jgi:hypothetical protein
MIDDVHDEYRPTGFALTFPNWLTQEGIRGDEESTSNSHTLITMFTRMLAGQGDNTICYYNERVDKKMDYGELQTISVMNLNWSFLTKCQLCGMKQKSFMQRSVSMA